MATVVLYVVVGIAVLIGALILVAKLLPRLERTPPEVAQYIDDFINESGDEWDWDDFTTVPIRDPILDSIRQRCSEIADDNPPIQDGEWCSPAGREELRQILDELRVAAV